MIICAAGDIHGAIDKLFDDVLEFEAALKVRFDHVLQVGDFGVWPDPAHIDKGTRNHEGAGDFPVWFPEQRPALRPTTFIAGNHEDFVFLEKRRKAGDFMLCPNLRWLPNGQRIELKTKTERIVLGGIGGCHGPANYERTYASLRGRAPRHFTHDQVEGLIADGPVDLLMTHDAPAGVEFTWKRKDGSVRRRYQSEADGLAEAVAACNPIRALFGHHHTRLDAMIRGVPCIGLNKSPHPGYLVAFEVRSSDRYFDLLGEWPVR